MGKDGTKEVECDSTVGELVEVAVILESWGRVAKMSPALLKKPSKGFAGTPGGAMIRDFPAVLPETAGARMMDCDCALSNKVSDSREFTVPQVELETQEVFPEVWTRNAFNGIVVVFLIPTPARTVTLGPRVALSGWRTRRCGCH